MVHKIEHDRFIVLKISDLIEALGAVDHNMLNSMVQRYQAYREGLGKEPNPKYYVCNVDESYAPAVLKAVLKGERKKQYVTKFPEIGDIITNQEVTRVQKRRPLRNTVVSATCLVCGHSHTYTWAGWQTRLRAETNKCNRCCAADLKTN